MTNLDELRLRVRDFARARDWEQFHTPRNLILALVGEVGELAAEFQWLTDGIETSDELTGAQAERIGAELADVLTYLIRLADVLEIDLAEQVLAKLAMNERRYPADIARGTSAKYTELGQSEDGRSDV